MFNTPTCLMFDSLRTVCCISLNVKALMFIMGQYDRSRQGQHLKKLMSKLYDLSLIRVVITLGQTLPLFSFKKYFFRFSAAQIKIENELNIETHQTYKPKYQDDKNLMMS